MTQTKATETLQAAGGRAWPGTCWLTNKPSGRVANVEAGAVKRAAPPFAGAMDVNL